VNSYKRWFDSVFEFGKNFRFGREHFHAWLNITPFTQAISVKYLQRFGVRRKIPIKIRRLPYGSRPD
jgi:hypothetical protein